MINRQRVARRSDLLGVLAVTVFSPDDLALVKGEPAWPEALARRCSGDRPSGP